MFSIVGVVYHEMSTYQNSQTSTMDDVLCMVSIFFFYARSVALLLMHMRRSKVCPSWRVFFFFFPIQLIIIILIDIDIDMNRNERDEFRTQHDHVHRLFFSFFFLICFTETEYSIVCTRTKKSVCLSSILFLTIKSLS